ncbi:hypothetical protein R1sor_002846 [Riccia sorocarpa]|uniref:PLAT domain-containing protein n=1 Tax=Riccia sorocarpa TaxID=122646 RepID=A0ABD3H2N8_9MARC
MASIRALLALAYLASVAVVAQGDCVYTIFVKTGWLPKSGTNSNIGLEFFDKKLHSYKIDNLTEWGNGYLADEGHNYFERTQLDVFTGYGKCFDDAICALNITTDGSGTNPGWYSEYVEVTVSGAGKACKNHHFEVEQWLATDTFPYSLTTHIDDCAAPVRDTAPGAEEED